MRATAGADAGVEIAAVGARLVVERERRLDVVGVDGPAERAARKRREDLARARRLFGRASPAGRRTARSRVGVSLTPVTSYGPSTIAVLEARHAGRIVRFQDGAQPRLPGVLLDGAAARPR